MTLAYSALALVLAILAVALLARRTPTGTHRAPRTPRAAEVTVTLEDLMRPTLYGVNDLAYCPAEDAETLHSFKQPGSRTCSKCGTETPTAVPRG